MNYFIVIILILLSAVFSGLTLGYFSLDKADLKRKVKLGDKQAKKIYQVRKNGNLLLCTLLIGNVAINSALSIFLGTLASGLVAGIMATILIVIFGEIIPQAAFSRFAMTLGAKFVWLVRIFIFVLYPICFVIAWALDKALGEEMGTIYSKKELIKIVEEHEDSAMSDIDADEEKILKGALTFSSIKVEDIATPRTEIFALPYDQKIDNNTKNKIFSSGHSRVPVYKKDLDNIVGILYVKDLIKTRKKTAGGVARNNVFFVDYNKTLDEVLNAFKKSRNHLSVVLDKYGTVFGIVTIEDILEEIIGEEIIDEHDRYGNLQKLAQKKLEKRKIKKI